MDILQRQSIKSTIYTYVGVMVGFIYTGILMPNFLTESEIGALNLILAYSLIFGQLGSLGFHTTTIRVFPYFMNRDKNHHGFLSLSVFVSIIGFGLVAVVYYLIKPWLVNQNVEDSPIFAGYFYLILPVAFFTIIYNQLDAYARALYFSTTGSFLKEFFQRILILIVVLLVVLNVLDQTGLFLAYAAALSLPAVFMAAFLVVKKEFPLTLNIGLPNKSLVRDMARMCFFGVLTGFGILAIAQIDRLMINYYLSEAETGIYSVAFYFGTLIIMPARSVQRIAGSIIATAFKENDLNTIKDMYVKTCLYQFMLSLLLFLLLWLNLDDIFTIIPPEYMDGKYVVFFIGLANVVAMAGGTSVSILISSRYYSYSAWFVGIYLLLIFVSNVFFIPRFGIAGAAAASALSTFFYILLQFLFIYRKWNFQPYDLRFVSLIAIGAFVYFIISLLPATEYLIINIAAKSTIILVLFVALVYFAKISHEFNKTMKGFVSKSS